MATNSVGKVSVGIVANGAQAVAEFGRVEGRAAAFGKKMSSALGGGLTAIGAGFSAGISASLTGSITGAISKVVSDLPGRLGDIGKVADFGQVLGLSAERSSALFGIGRAMGADAKEFFESLSTMGKLTADALAGNGEVATGFFQSLNLNAAEFAKLAPDQQFLRLTDSLRAMEDPGQRARNLMVAWGEDGGKLLTKTLTMSRAELEALGQQFTRTTQDVASAQVATESITAATNATSRAYDGLLVSLSPVAMFLSDQLKSRMDDLTDSTKAWGLETIDTAAAVEQRLLGVATAFGWIGGAIEATGGAFTNILGEVTEVAGLATGDESLTATGEAMRIEGERWMAQGIGAFGGYGEASRKIEMERLAAREKYLRETAKKEKDLDAAGNVQHGLGAMDVAGWQRGIGDVSFDLTGSGKGGASGALADAIRGLEYRLPEAMYAGSVEAQSVVNQALAGPPRDDVARQQKVVLDALNRGMTELNQRVADLNRTVAKGGGGVGFQFS